MKSFESKGKFIDQNGTERNDTSAAIFESMLLSEAYLDLTPKQRLLYLYCKAQYFGKRKPKQDFQDLEQIDNECFYLPWVNMKNYKLYGQKGKSEKADKNASKEFYKDMTALVKHGFIKKIGNGGHGKKNIFKFISEWQKWSK